MHPGLAPGCRRLLRDGAARVEEPGEIRAGPKLNYINHALADEAAPAARGHRLDNPGEMLLDALGFEPATLDVLAARSGLPGELVASILLNLELEGRLAPYPGGRDGRTR